MRPIFTGFLLSTFLFSLLGEAMAQNDDERPIIARGVEGLLAFDVDGALRADLGDLWGPSWHPDGTRIAVLVPHGRVSYPAIFERTGTGYYLFPDPPEGTFLYRPLWSPNGQSIALIRHGPSGFAFVVVDVKTAEVVAEGEIPDRFSAGFPFYTAGIDTFSWSPDGSSILLSWQGVLVFDVPAAKVKIASEDFALAFWSPDSSGVCLLQYKREAPNPIVLGHIRQFDLAKGTLREIATPAEIKRAGIDRASWLTTGSIQLSPDGKSVALSMGSLGKEGDAIRVYKASENCIADIGQPREVIETTLVPVMEWSPDARALAVVEQLKGSGPSLKFAARVIDLETHNRVTLTELEFDGPEVDVLGLLGVLAWSR